MKIALTGNPNCGKTTLFNILTGDNQYVGNWPGVTVEKKEGKLKAKKNIQIIDLPGIYSLSPFTMEEVVTKEYLEKDTPDLLINIVDATNLEKSLYLTMQLIELEVPMVVGLNMMDLVEKRDIKIDIEKLSNQIGCQVFSFSKSDKLIDVLKLTDKEFMTKCPKIYSEDIETKILEIKSNFKINKHTALLRLKNDEKVANQRYGFIEKVVKNSVKLGKKDNIHQKIDNIVCNKYLALPIFFGIMGIMYYISIQLLGSYFTNQIEFLFEMLSTYAQSFLSSIGTSSWLIGLVSEGFIGGVGSVLSFFPQIIILFFFITLLEDCGYMARVAFIMDTIFKHIGLSGKSFIPMVIGTGCSVPAIMSTRTIENDLERKMTIMLTPFVPCSAKLPVFALLSGIFFPNNPFVAPSMYIIGFFSVIISGMILKCTKPFKNADTGFVMELPEYQMPKASSVFLQVYSKGKEFVIKAGTIIFIACGIIYIMTNFNFAFQLVEIEKSMLANIGSFIAPIFIPLGFGNWQSSVALISGFVAKENIIATFEILLRGKDITSILSSQSSYAFMVFTLLSSPCFAAIATIKKEMASIKWTAFAIVYQTSFAYIIAFITYNIIRIF